MKKKMYSRKTSKTVSTALKMMKRAIDTMDWSSEDDEAPDHHDTSNKHLNRTKQFHKYKKKSKPIDVKEHEQYISSSDSEAEVLRERQQKNAFVYTTDSSTDSDEDVWKQNGIPIIRSSNRKIKNKSINIDNVMHTTSQTDWSNPMFLASNFLPSAPPYETLPRKEQIPKISKANSPNCSSPVCSPPPPPPPPPPPALLLSGYGISEPVKIVINRSGQRENFKRSDPSSSLLAELKSAMSGGVKNLLRGSKKIKHLENTEKEPAAWDQLMTSIKDYKRPNEAENLVV